MEGLDDVAKPKNTPPSKSFERGSNGWSLTDCVESVLEVREALRSSGLGYSVDEPDSAGNTLRLSALACTAHLSGEMRFQAMELAQQGSLVALLEFVQAELEQEGQRRLAAKAISNAFPTE